MVGFYMYGAITRLAMLAATLELEQLEHTPV
jgi:hypothetical protein